MSHNEETIRVVPGDGASPIRGDDPGNSQSGRGMEAMARENQQFHLAHAPGAEALTPNPFPPVVIWGLAAGVLIGAIAGLVFGLLLLSGTLVFENWEQLYSMTPGTFGTFWTGIGAAVGGVVGGLVTIFVAPAPAHASQAESGHDHEEAR